MCKIEVTRAQLVWPGKYDENGDLVPPRHAANGGLPACLCRTQ